MIEQGTTPNFYLNKLCVELIYPTKIQLNPFEFFFFHFAHYIKDLTTIPEFGNNDQVKLLYLNLLENYLIEFLPTNSNIKSKKKFNSIGSVAHICEMVINILTDMWLNKKSNSAKPIQNDCPNVIYMMGVRVFIKRVHCLANSLTDKSLKMGNTRAFENHELDEIKKSVWTSKYQIPKLFYNFLKLSFEHWPCDSSFRIPLEAWLSYIQPWSYLNEPSAMSGLLADGRSLSISNLNSSGGPTTATASLPNLNKWKGFIQENILFYTTIYKEILVRFMNLDLLSLKNANMLFRITKVYCQLNLSDLIRKAEANCETAVTNSGLASASLGDNSQSICNKDFSFTNLLEDNEKTGFVYVSFFSEEIKKSLIKLLAKIRATIEKIERIETSSLGKNQLIEVLYYISGIKLTLEEIARTRPILETVQRKLAQLHQIDLDTVGTEQQGRLANQLLNSGDRFDLTDLDEEAMVQERLRQAYEIPFGNGNPDFHPVQKHELYYPVITFIRLSQAINEHYQETFKHAYESDGLVGWLAKKLLAMPQKYKLVEENGTIIEKTLEPRVNLRFLASKKSHAFMVIIFMLIMLLDYDVLNQAALWMIVAALVIFFYLI